MMCGCVQAMFFSKAVHGGLIILCTVVNYSSKMDNEHMKSHPFDMSSFSLSIPLLFLWP